MLNKNIIKYISNLLRLGLCITFLLTVKVYSQKIGLFNQYEILIKGNSFLSKEEIKENINNYLIPNYFSINLEMIKANINSLEFIEATQVSFLLPNKLIINIIERNPIALITIEDQNYFIDKNATLLPVEENSINFFPVPIININDLSNYNDNMIIKISNVFQLLVSNYPSFYTKLSEVIIDNREWTFFSDAKTKIFVSQENINNQIYTLKAFESTVYPMKTLADYSYIDLRIPKQIIVKEKYIKG